MPDLPAQVLSIGHSNHPVERFIALLRAHEVTAVADVRSTPFSRRHPQFNKERLDAALKQTEIVYVFLGKELGARTTDLTCYDENGRVSYGRIARTAPFQEGIERVVQGAAKYRLALMCAEREPLDCHRTLLVTPAVEARGLPVAHILADGRLEAHRETMLRLVDSMRLPRSDMFRSQDDLIAEAARRQEERIAYVDKNLAREPR
jgi:uncharacterized protein (DUF488 family)